MKNTHTEYLSSERTPTVYPELEELLPALSEEEFSALETDILTNGCYTPITVNQDMAIVDGHNRFRICQKHDLSFRMQVFRFDDLLEAKAWALQTQQGRRNLGKWALAKIAMKLKPEWEEKAKENQGARTDLFPNSEKGAVPVNTTREIAKAVGIGTDTMSKAIQIRESNLPAVEAALDDGTLSIHKGYSIVKRLEQLPTEQRQQAAEAAVQAVKSGQDAARTADGEYVPKPFYDAVAQNEIQQDLAGSLTDILLENPPEERDQLAEEMIEATRDLYQRDKQIDEEHKTAKDFINGFYYAGLVKATMRNVRCYIQCARLDEDDLALAAEEAYDIAENFKAVGDLIQNEFLPRDWKERREIIDVECEDA